MLYNKKKEEFIISQQKTHHTKQFKLDVINYRKEHPDLTQVECAKNLGNCLRGYLLCQQLSWQNFSFYFVLNLDTGPNTLHQWDMMTYSTDTRYCTQIIEPPCTERYARWCERSATQLMGSLLFD